MNFTLHPYIEWGFVRALLLAFSAGAHVPDPWRYWPAANERDRTSAPYDPGRGGSQGAEIG